MSPPAHTRSCWLAAAATAAFVVAAAAPSRAATLTCSSQLDAIAAAVPTPLPAVNGTPPDLSWFVVDHTWCRESNPCYTACGPLEDVGGVGAARDCCPWPLGQAAAAATARPTGAGSGGTEGGNGPVDYGGYGNGTEGGSTATAGPGLGQGSAASDAGSSKEFSMVRGPVSARHSRACARNCARNLSVPWGGGASPA